MDVHKHPNGTYYVRFQWLGTPVNRSCRTKDRRIALPIAKRIRRDYILRQSQGKPTASVACKERKLKDIIKLFDRYVEESDNAPRPDTAKKYAQKLRGWIKILRVTTVTELKQAFADYSLKKENARRQKANIPIAKENDRRKIKGEKEKKLLPLLSKGGYAASLREAAAIFSKDACKYYKRHGFHIENPLSGEVPKSEVEKFIVPPGGLNFISELFEAAEKELRGDKQLYPIFLLCLGAGLRVQEATHVNWGHIQANGIHVRCDEVHRTKSGKSRLVPAGSSLKQRLIELQPSNVCDEDFIAPDLRKRTTGSEIKKCKSRCDRRVRKLNSWLRSKGVNNSLTTHPCHYLRKLFGASILTRHSNGLQLAKKYLGHASTDITEKIYVDLLETPEVDVLPDIETKPEKNESSN